MKYRFSSRFFLIFSLCCSLQNAHTFAQAKQGAIAFVNAVPLETPTEILFNGLSIRPDGFETGRITSFIAFPNSSTAISAKNGDIPCKPLIFTPSAEGSSIIIIYLLENQTKEGQIKQELHVLSIPSAAASSGYNQRLLLVGSSQGMSLLVNGANMSLIPGQPSQTFSSGSLNLETTAREPIGNFSSGEPGNFLTVIFPDLKGGFGSTSIRDNMITFSE